MSKNQELIDRLKIAIYADEVGGSNCAPAGPDPWPSELGDKNLYFSNLTTSSCPIDDTTETVIISLDSNKLIVGQQIAIDTYFYSRADIAANWISRRIAQPSVTTLSDFVRSVKIFSPASGLHVPFGQAGVGITVRCPDADIASLGSSQRCSCSATDCGSPICSPKARAMVKKTSSVTVRPIVPGNPNPAIAAIKLYASWGMGYTPNHDPAVMQSTMNTSYTYTAGPACSGSSSETFAFPTKINVRYRIKKYYHVSGTLIANNYISKVLSCEADGSYSILGVFTLNKDIPNAPQLDTGTSRPISID